MSKKKVPVTILSDFRSDIRKPYKWKEVRELLAKEAIVLEDDDHLEIGYIESHDGDEDDRRYVMLTRHRLETDEEYKVRLEGIATTNKYFKERRYENYLRLKAEFEDGVEPPPMTEDDQEY